MSNFYYPGIIPEEYNQAFLNEEFERIAAALSALEVPTILLTPQYVEPTRPQEGMAANADGTEWNPGHGAGLYQYIGAEWIPMFSTNQGIVLSQVSVANTTTETEIYSGVLDAIALHTGDMSVLTIGGSYDTGAASDTWTLRLKLGATTIHTVTRQSGNNVTGAGWVFEVMTTIRTEGVSGTFIDLANLEDDDASITVSDATTHTIDTTIDNTVSVTIQWGAAKAANIFRLDQGIIEHKH